MFYYKLEFTKNNYCYNLIAKKSLRDSLNIKESIIDEEILERRDIEYIVELFNDNPKEKTKEIVDRIYNVMGWDKGDFHHK